MKHGMVTLMVLALGSPALAEIEFSAVAHRAGQPVNALPPQATFDLTVTAEWPQSDIMYVVYTPSMPQLAGLVIEDHLSFGETTTMLSQLVQRTVHHFRLLVTNSVGTTVETGPIQVEYRPSNREEKQRRQLAGITLTVAPPARALHAPLMLGGAAIAAVALFAFGGVCMVRRRRRAPVLPVEHCLEDAYTARLMGLKQLRMQGDTARYFGELETVLRDYVRDKYQIGSLETYLPPRNGATGLDARSVSVARDLLALAHTVRYGGQAPSDYDQTRMLDFVHTLIDRNRPRQHTSEELDYLQPEHRS